jgi:putative alpha-1,2-mannosidase
MPIIGEVKIEEEHYSSKFDKETEVAEPGYYSVMLNDHDILAQLTVTCRAGFHTYTFPKNNNSHIIFDVTHNLADDDPIDGDVEIIGNNKIAGSVTIPNPFCGGKTPYTIYFSALISRPFEGFGIWKDGKVYSGKRSDNGKDIGCFLDYNTTENEEISVKLGVSFVSKKQALLNVNQEIPDWDFDKVKKQANRVWNKKLNKIRVKGGSEEDKVKFYTALYHALLGPYTASDVNGKYRGMDNKIHTTKDHTYYHVYSLWDTFRSEHPLLTLVEPEQQNEIVKSLLDKQKQGGWLPKWEFANRYTNCMIADHATSVIAESYLKRIRDYDIDYAYQAMRKNSVNLPGQGNIRVISKSGDFTPLQLDSDGKARLIYKKGGKIKNLAYDWNSIYNDLQWHHFLLRYDDQGNLQIYIDNNKVAETSDNINFLDNKEPWKFGVHRIDKKSGIYFTGNVSRIGFYDRALSRDEIGKLAKKVEVKKGRQITFPNRRRINPEIEVNGDPQFTQLSLGQSIIFDGIDDEVRINHINSKNNELTLSFWFKTSLPTDFEGRRGLDFYLKYGYIPHDLDWGGWGSVSTTLEDAYNDYCIARVARDMGKTADYKMFKKRAGFYRNLFDRETGFMRPKNHDGSWKKPFSPEDWEGFTEGNSWSYSWFVPHDVAGLMKLMGKEEFVQKLDHLFSDWVYPKWDEPFSNYWHGNEPSQQVPYYYNYAGEPWKTQKVVDAIMDELYGTEANGIPGNEDVGQLSAWFVLSAMGFHPVAPAQCTYLVGRPLFDEITIYLDDKYYDAQKFEIYARNNSANNKYVQSLSINGEKTNKTWFDHQLISKGCKIIFEMGSHPNKNWGSRKNSLPPSISTTDN